MPAVLPPCFYVPCFQPWCLLKWALSLLLDSGCHVFLGIHLGQALIVVQFGFFWDNVQNPPLVIMNFSKRLPSTAGGSTKVPASRKPKPPSPSRSSAGLFRNRMGIMISTINAWATSSRRPLPPNADGDAPCDDYRSIRLCAFKFYQRIHTGSGRKKAVEVPDWVALHIQLKESNGDLDIGPTTCPGQNLRARDFDHSDQERMRAEYFTDLVASTSAKEAMVASAWTARSTS